MRPFEGALRSERPDVELIEDERFEREPGPTLVAPAVGVRIDDQRWAVNALRLKARRRIRDRAALDTIAVQHPGGRPRHVGLNVPLRPRFHPDLSTPLEDDGHLRGLRRPHPEAHAAAGRNRT